MGPSEAAEAKAAAPDKPGPEPSEEQLQECLLICRAIYQALHNHDFENPLIAKHIAPGYTMRLDIMEEPVTLEEWISSVWPGMRSEREQYQPEVLNESIDYDSKTGWTSVWYVIRLRDYPDGLVRDGLGVAKWRLGSDGVWRVYETYRYRNGFGQPIMFNR